MSSLKTILKLVHIVFAIARLFKTLSKIITEAVDNFIIYAVYDNLLVQT